MPSDAVQLTFHATVILGLVSDREPQADRQRVAGVP